MKKTRVGIVGMGLIGKAHLDALRRLPQVEIIAICEHTAEDAKAYAARYDVPQWYTDCATMIAQADLDAVHNCTPNAAHDGVNRAILDAGKHVYAEKPLSSTAQGALDAWRHAERAGVVHGLNHQYRMNAAVQEMRVRVASGEIGRVFLASGRYHQQSGLYDTDYNWRMTEGGLTCGLSDIGTHWVDTACCVLGRRVKRVFANVQTIHAERTRPDGTRVPVATDDLSSMLLEFDGGIQGALTVSKVSAGHMNDLALGIDGQHFSMYWEQENQSHLKIGYKRAPNVDFQMTPALASPEVADLVTLPGGHVLAWNDALLASVREFYAVVQGDKAQSAMRCATFADGYEGMAFVEAALRSSQSGQWAPLAR